MKPSPNMPKRPTTVLAEGENGVDTLKRYCLRCKWYTKEPNSLPDCTRQWHDLITGEVVSYGRDRIKCWHARKEYCGPTGVGFQPR